MRPDTAQAATCGPEFLFIGARGSGEGASGNGGMGAEVWDVYQLLSGKLGSRVQPYGVNYPAVDILHGTGLINGAGAFLHVKPLGAYTDSVRAGATDIVNKIRAAHAACSTTRFFLAGYSQGAQAVGDVLQKSGELSASELGLIAGVALFGDPYFNALSWSSQAADASHYGLLGVRDEWPDSLRGRVFSYCHTHDPICNLSKRVHVLGTSVDIYVRDALWFRGDSQHYNYRPDDTSAAATQLAGLAGVKPQPSGTVPLDLVFAIDSTGSMGSVIDQVKNNVTALAQSIASTSSSYRFALVDYKDYGDPYQARVDLDFTTDTTAFASAVASITAAGGGDTPESVYSGVMAGLNLGWRPGVRKVVLPIGDAPGKDPEPNTGFTLAQVQARALAVDPAELYPLVLSPDAQSFMQAMADATGGVITVSDGSTDVVPQLQAAIVKAGSAPTATAGGPYDGYAGDSITFSGGGSRPGSDFITQYAWDWNSDGTYDQTSSDPVVQHTFDTPGTYTVTLRVTDASGLSALATADVTVTEPPAAPPYAPVGLHATPGDGSVTLTWTQPTAGVRPTYFVIRDGAGNVLDTISAGADGSAPTAWIDDSLTNGQAYTYSVTAGNARGESAPAGPVSATPTGGTGFNFKGFFAPVKNSPAVNSVENGSAIPLKFSLGGNRGSHVLAANSPTVTRIDCRTKASIGSPEPAKSLGVHRLTFDRRTGTYVFIWKTARSWERTCRRIDVTLTDGSVHSALFSFR